MTPVGGGWGNWTSWSKCDKTCGGGSETRLRQCDNPGPSGGGKPCNGSYSASRACANTECPPGKFVYFMCSLFYYACS